MTRPTLAERIAFVRRYPPPDQYALDAAEERKRSRAKAGETPEPEAVEFYEPKNRNDEILTQIANAEWDEPVPPPKGGEQE